MRAADLRKRRDLLMYWARRVHFVETKREAVELARRLNWAAIALERGR